MKRIINIIKGKRDFSYLLDMSVDLMKKYRTGVTKYNYYDLVVKKIRSNNDSMSLWIGYISDTLLTISDCQTMGEQIKTIKNCIIEQIGICLLSQEFFPNRRSDSDLIVLAKIVDDNCNDIDAIVVEQEKAYVLSQATIYSLEYLLISEYNEKDSIWAYAYGYLYDNWLDISIKIALEDDIDNKKFLVEIYKSLDKIKTEYCEIISQSGSLNFDLSVINEYFKYEEAIKKPGVMHFGIENP